MPTTTKTRKATTRKSTARKSTRKAPKAAVVPCYSVAAVRGIQASCEYYTLMMPVRMLAKSFLGTDLEMPAEMRAQRLPNARRVKQTTQYILDNFQRHLMQLFPEQLALGLPASLYLDLL